jgi:hypothetical protein
LTLGEKAAEHASGARDLNPPAAEVIISSTEIARAEIAERTNAPPLQPPAETGGANDMIADR